MLNKILAGTRILDFSAWLAGPYAAALLADMGAEVIRVEKPGGAMDRDTGEMLSNGIKLSIGLVTSRNKKSITLNFRTEKGEKILEELIKKTDVVIHNSPPGTKDNEALSYERLSKINPRIIEAMVSGFGQDGPYARRLSFDAVCQAICGTMSYTGFPGQPPVRSAFPFADFGTALHTAVGISLALLYREKTGKGQKLDVSMLDVAVAMIASTGVVADYAALGVVRESLGNRSAHSYGNCFQTKDGWVYFGLIGNDIWRRFLKLLGREDLVNDPRFSDDMARAHHHADITPLIEPWVAGKTTAEAVQLLDKSYIPCGWVNDIPHMMQDPQVKARKVLSQVTLPGEIKIPTFTMPVRFSETPAAHERGISLPGDNNQEIYGTLLGRSAAELATLKEENTI